jgi:hypothetical protein
LRSLARQPVYVSRMAISGYKTLTVTRTTRNRKRLAESGMAKRQGQSVNTRCPEGKLGFSDHPPSLGHRPIGELRHDYVVILDALAGFEQAALH